MVVSSIGVQQILPRSGMAWQRNDPASDRSDEGDDNPAAPRRKKDRAPPAPGTGEVVDRDV